MLYGHLIKDKKENDDILNIILPPGEEPTESNEEKSQPSSSGVAAAPVSPKQSYLGNMYKNVKNILSNFLSSTEGISTYDDWFVKDY